ncbi:putative Zinc finger, RING/FYVE/PHD-type, protein strawberry notch [Medicago truncatula]|uniref:Putative Zinc finger, RING/FYVE/PHD-type, protein strawberry notch n=1 Tax=Medicago truncatula TaxID=3880 RepID=A0A396HKJ6_MEDTR|nr:protein FORGETTER 1 [Medicago truncatula]RHN53138.1 putative Zinc finger, RING/FYVE/PHD-type, protein strawberry notch [Medicago truncatula]
MSGMNKKKSPNLEQLRMELKTRRYRRHNPYTRPQTLNPPTKPNSSRSSFTSSTSLPRSFPNRKHHQPPPPPPKPPVARKQRCTNCRTCFSAPPGVVQLPCPICQIASSAVKIQCFHCKALVKGPSDLVQFPCPLCFVILDVGDADRKQEEEVNELVEEVEQEEGDGGVAGETFTDYRPSKLSIGPPHPDPIVETSSLSAVQPPEPTYDPMIKNDLERSKALSCLQIETLVYACQRHLQHIPSGARAGFFLGDGAGVGKGRTVAGIIWENWHHGRRKALWISVGSDLKFDARRDLDDMGASCIAVHALNKLPYVKLDSKSVGVKEGVIFSTYSSLIASSDRGRTRMQQLVQWCGPEFDGLIIFDECHKAKNLVPEKDKNPTKTGQAVLAIQAQLPEARIVYCSATGASEPRNMAYMVRLGLWGAGTCFPDFSDFLGALEKGGVGALELVAMDMKARGMYLCRTLSYKGAEFEIVDASLDDRMTHAYKKATEVWVDLHEELLSAIDLCAQVSTNNINTRKIWALYWASHQRFFRHLCMSAKVPTVVRLVKQALMEDKCVVIGLQSTGEARTEDAVTKYGSELDDFISGPRELLLKFVEDNFPLPKKPEILHADDGVKELQRKRHLASRDVSGKSRVKKVAKCQPPSDAESDEESKIVSGLESSDPDYEFPKYEIKEEMENLLQCSLCGKYAHQSFVPPIGDFVLEKWACDLCKDKSDKYLLPGPNIIELHKSYDTAMQSRHKILERICALDLPKNPLDDIIDQLGGHDKVAEITGRKGMLVRAPSGTGVFYQTRYSKDVTADMVNMNEKKLFMEGTKLVAIISEAGSAGVSLQADRRVKNQKRRVHLTLELPWSADRAIQQFGRTHRSNQVSAPEYRLLFSNLGGERRFASAVAKRLESLGALTQGDRRAGPSLNAYNYDSEYGKRALELLYGGILGKDPLPVVPPGCLSDRPDTIKDFIMQAKAALVSVNIFKDDGLGGDMDCSMDDKYKRNIRRFLNRLLGIAPEIQNRLFELFVNILDLLVHKARIEGNFDTGIVDLKATVIELQGNPKTVYVDQMSGASADLFTFTLDRGVSWELANTMLNEKQKAGFCSDGDGFYKSNREWLGRHHFILAFESSAPSMCKIVRPTTGESTRDMNLAELTLKYSKVSSLKEAQIGWENEYEVSSKQCMHGPNCKKGKLCSVGSRLQQVNVLGGVIFPIWGNVLKAISKKSQQILKRLRVVRVETTSDNSRRIVGLFVPKEAVDTVLQDLQFVIVLDD